MNSCMPSRMESARLVGINLKTRFRPDKLFLRDEFMKWDMIYNSIDTPHRLANGTAVAVTSRTQLCTELNELTDFHI